MENTCLFADVYDFVFNNQDDRNVIQTVVKVLITAFSFVGVIGNILICYVILHNRHMHTTTNYYLFSLAVADGTEAATLICSTLYTEIIRYFGSDLLVVIVYEIITFLYLITSCSSIAVSLAFTVDRYIAICHPFLGRSIFTLSRTIYTIIAIWLIVTLYCIGLAFCTTEHGYICDKYRLFSVELFSLLFFFIPITLNFVLYLLIGIKVFQSSRLFDNQSTTRSNSNMCRSLKMSVATIAECCICWAPMHIFSLMHKHYHAFRLHNEEDAIILLAYIMYLLSTVINPVVYCVMSKTFRKSFKVALFSGGNINNFLTVKFKKRESSNAPETETTS